MNWSGKKVLVTGAGGFIGSHLAERLVESGADVRAFVHYNALESRGWLSSSKYQDSIEIIAGDICDTDSVRNAVKGCDIVFHLAALIAIPYSYLAPESYVKTNVLGTLNIMRACMDYDVERFLNTSTSEVYGTAQFVPITEEHPLQGQSPYSASKIGADKLVESFYLSFDLPAVIVRPFNTYGPRQSTRAVIPTIITQCLDGKDVKLGNLDARRDMNFVGNTVDGFLAAASSKDAIGKTMNFGSGFDVSIGELAEKIISLSGNNSKIICEKKRMRPEGSEVDRLQASHDLAKEVTGWTPALSLDEGLEVTIEWFRENLHRYRSGEYTI